MLAHSSFTDLDLADPARRAAAHLVKMRARTYVRRPMALDALHPGLSAAPPETLVAIAEHLVEREERSPRRWFGFGGEVSLLNARAALLLGRARRRLEARTNPISAGAVDALANVSHPGLRLRTKGRARNQKE